MDPYITPPAQPQPSPFLIAGPEAEEAAGFDFWGVLNRRKWIVFLGLITGMGLASLFYSKSETVYESQAAVKIEPKKRIPTPISGGSQGLFPEYDDGIRHDRLMSQENIILRMFNENQNLLKLDSLKDFPELAEKIEYIAENFETTQDREEPSLYQVTLQNSERRDAEVLLANLLDTYKRNLIDQYERDEDEVVSSLLGFEERFQKEYKVEQKKLEELINHRTQTTTMLGQNMSESQMLLMDVSKKLSATRDELKDLTQIRNRIYAAMENGTEGIRQIVWQLRSTKKMPSASTSRNGRENLIARYQLRIDSAEDEYLTLRDRLGDGHPSVKLASNRLDRINDSFEEALAGESELMNGDERPLTDEEALASFLDLTSSQIEALQAELNYSLEAYALHSAETKKLVDLNERISLQAEHTDDIKRYLDLATEKIVQLDPNRENGANNQEGFRFQLTREASEGKPIWPILPVILGIGGMLGSLAGFGLGCLVELADKTFHNPDEIMKHLNMPLIGHIPVITQNKRYNVEGSLIEPTICTYHRPKSQTSEAFRAVRTAIYFNTQGKKHSVIQITSPTPGDGKSTLASNLAVSIAQSGKRVLLVDADMRRPRQHHVFGIEATEGFATVLSGESAWQDCLYECSEIGGLTLMPCGKKPQNPAELSSSPQVKELIESLRKEFDFVIIDTPPVLAVTDACPIAARVDGVILTLRIKKNVRVSAERASEMLQNIGANCIGLVVNGVGAQSGYGSQYTYGAYRAGYSYNGYGYGYGYGHGYGVGKYYEEDQRGRKVSPATIEAPTIEADTARNI